MLLQTSEFFPLLLIHPFIRPSIRSFTWFFAARNYTYYVIHRTVCTSIPNPSYLCITLYSLAASVKLFNFLTIALFYNTNVYSYNKTNEMN